MCETLRKHYKQVQLHKCLVCTYKSQDFAQSQKFFARSHNRGTMTFRNSRPRPIQYVSCNVRGCVCGMSPRLGPGIM